MIIISMDEARQILWAHVLKTRGGVEPGDPVANAPELCRFVCKYETLGGDREDDCERFVTVDRVEIRNHGE